MLPLLSFVFAFCSLCYNFVFSHALAATMGSSIMHYCIGIGVYLFSLGLSSIYFDSVAHKVDWGFIFKLEILISAIALSGVFFILYLNVFIIKYDLALMSPFMYLPTILLGVASGLELPSLLVLSRRERTTSFILSMDYVGMSVISLMFSFMLVSVIGLFYTLTSCMLLNAVVMLGMPKSDFLKFNIKFAFYIIVSCGFFLFSPYLQDAAQSIHMSVGMVE